MTFDEELDYFSNKPFYTKTNENLISILEGLNINNKSNTLAIAGSGDQAFSMISRNAKVKIVDIEKKQIDLVKNRKEYLLNKDLNNFIKSEYGIYDSPRIDIQRNEFLKDNLNLIRKNISNLYINETPNDFFNILKLEGKNYNSIYLSNIISYYENVFDVLEKYSIYLKKGTKIYYSDSSNLNIKNSNKIIIDKLLTKKAKKYNNNSIWNPVIFETI